MQLSKERLLTLVHAFAKKIKQKLLKKIFDFKAFQNNATLKNAINFLMVT